MRKTRPYRRGDQYGKILDALGYLHRHVKRGGDVDVHRTVRPVLFDGTNGYDNDRVIG